MSDEFKILFVIAIAVSVIVIFVHAFRSADSLSEESLPKGRSNAEDPEVLRLLSGDLRINNVGTKTFSGGGSSNIFDEANQWFANNPHIFNVRADFKIMPLPGFFTHWARLNELRITYNVCAEINERQYMLVELKKYGILPFMFREDSVINEWLSNNPGARIICSDRFNSFTNQGNSSLQIFALTDCDAPERLADKKDTLPNNTSTTAVSSVKENTEKVIPEPQEETHEKHNHRKVFGVVIPLMILVFVGFTIGGYAYYSSIQQNGQPQVQEQNSDVVVTILHAEDSADAENDAEEQKAGENEQLKQYTPTSTVNVRAEDNQDSEKLGYLSPGDVVTGTGESYGNWLQIYYTADGSDPNAVGWVSQNYMTGIGE